MTQDEARARVAKGAAHLDRVRPGWFNRIDVGTLCLSNCLHCVIGQLTGSYFHSCDLGLNSLTTRVMGFNIDLDDTDMMTAFQMLQDAWIEAIAGRRLRHGQRHRRSPFLNAAENGGRETAGFRSRESRPATR